LSNFVSGSNNVAWRNITVLGNTPEENSAIVGLECPTGGGWQFYDIKCQIAISDYEECLSSFAHLYIQLSDDLYARYLESSGWLEGAGRLEGLEEVEGNKFLVKDCNASGAFFRDIILYPDEFYTVRTFVEFFNPFPMSEKFEFDISLMQEQNVIGGEHYTVSGDFEAMQYRSAKLNKSSQENKTAPYSSIVSISPNPANSQITVEYSLGEIDGTAALQILSGEGLVITSVPVSAAERLKTVSLSGLMTGNYFVQLITKGKVADSKTLIKQ
jgi:hypothetical protein